MLGIWQLIQVENDWILVRVIMMPVTTGITEVIEFVKLESRWHAGIDAQFDDPTCTHCVALLMVNIDVALQTCSREGRGKNFVFTMAARTELAIDKFHSLQIALSFSQNVHHGVITLKNMQGSCMARKVTCMKYRRGTHSYKSRSIAVQQAVLCNEYKQQSVFDVQRRCFARTCVAILTITGSGT